MDQTVERGRVLSEYWLSDVEPYGEILLRQNLTTHTGRDFDTSSQTSVQESDEGPILPGLSHLEASDADTSVYKSPFEGFCGLACGLKDELQVERRNGYDTTDR